jgi:hypothetical protein
MPRWHVMRTLLPNDLIVIMNQGVDHRGHGDIKRVLESQENTHNMVEVQANLVSRSLTSSPTWSPGPHCFKLMYKTHSTSDLGELHMHGNIRR